MDEDSCVKKCQAMIVEGTFGRGRLGMKCSDKESLDDGPHRGNDKGLGGVVICLYLVRCIKFSKVAVFHVYRLAFFRCQYHSKSFYVCVALMHLYWWHVKSIRHTLLVVDARKGSKP